MNYITPAASIAAHVALAAVAAVAIAGSCCSKPQLYVQWILRSKKRRMATKYS